uniref:PTB domain-containing engulfment adapter protein 1-like n=1 Tax=Paramormyrops kingsleyae TaxID=1676925 RepID=A0A3B3T3B9_9TELE
MNDIYENDNDISFPVKFVGRIEVVRPVGLQLLSEALASLKNSDHVTSSEGKGKKSKVSLFLSMNGIDILEHDTKFMLYTCPLFLVSFCAVHPTLPNHFGFVAQHPASDAYYCYLFRSKKFSHLLVSLIGDAFHASKRDENIGRNRDLVVEALRHRNKTLLKENAELKRRIAALTQGEELDEDSLGVSVFTDALNAWYWHVWHLTNQNP